MPLTAKDYEAALFVQDACNLSGVIHSWSEIVSRIWKEADKLGKGTDWVNRHPINILFASKVASLTDCERTFEFSKAYAYCEKRKENDQM